MTKIAMWAWVILAVMDILEYGAFSLIGVVPSARAVTNDALAAHAETALVIVWLLYERRNS